jgi:urease accessory protein
LSSNGARQSEDLSPIAAPFLAPTPASAETSFADPSQSQWLLWQLADSAFPSGSFAHSSGLEAVVQQQELRHAGQLPAFLDASLCQVGHAMLPFVTAAHRAPSAFRDLDRLCDAFATNHVANRASRLQGKAMLASVEQAFRTPELVQFRQTSAAASAFCHFAPVFGVVTRALGLENDTASRLFLYFHVRGLISAAVRLGVVGPLQGQGIQLNMTARAEEILQDCRHRSIDSITQTAPLLDLWQANQDRLYSRLFQS